MRRKNAWWIFGIAFIVLMGLAFTPRAQFVLGGTLVNLGYRMQDHLHAYDLQHEHDISPQDILAELEKQNLLASSVRTAFPRSNEHPKIALLVCMDARIDTSELVGDTRRYYYIVRTAGSALGPAEQDMLELAVQNGVKVVVLTTHTDCAAEKVAADPEKAAHYAALTQLVAEREQRVAEFLNRPLIKERVQKGELVVKRMLVDTASERLIDLPPGFAHPVLVAPQAEASR